MLLVACGPASASSDSGELEAQTAQIARDFAADHDLNRAREAVDSLQVANPRQWLMMITEESISAGEDPDTTAALVSLTGALKIQSAFIQRYADANGLTAATPVAAATPVLQNLVNTPLPTVAVPTAVQQGGDTAGESTAAPVVEIALPEPTATPAEPALPQGRSTALINVRNGPGTDYNAVAALNSDELVDLIGKNPEGDWLQVQLANGAKGWVLGQLLETTGDLAAVSVVTDIPEPPPTATAAPVAAAPEPAQEPAAEAAPAPAEEAAAPPAAGPDFRLVSTRLWDVYENGGYLDGPTVTCGEKRQLVVVVLDANGNRINGVSVQALLGAKEIIVTGSQGKGDGVAEFVLGNGQYVTVARDSDGREVTSDTAYGLSTDPHGISDEALIAGQYCSDGASCNSFRDGWGCYGHYSWTVTFQRKS